MGIVRRSDNVRGFVILPRRWVVERTFSWFTKPASCKGFREPCQNLGHLRDPRLYPACAQAAGRRAQEIDQQLLLAAYAVVGQWRPRVAELSVADLSFRD